MLCYIDEILQPWAEVILKEKMLWKSNVRKKNYPCLLFNVRRKIHRDGEIKSM